VCLPDDPSVTELEDAIGVAVRVLDVVRDDHARAPQSREDVDQELMRRSVEPCEWFIEHEELR
jgi:hypothetical protein